MHVECADGGEVLVQIGDEVTPPYVWQNHHMRSVDARKALRIVEQHQQRFLAEWERLHG